MNIIRKILSIFTALTLFLMFSISPVLAEEATGSIDGSSGANEAVIETVIDLPDADEDVVETVIDISSTDKDVVETVVAIPSAEEEVVETVVAIPSTAEEPEYLDSDVLNVIVPIMLSITIDPLELSGKGQIYSNNYKIKNYGDTDVMLTFTDIQVTFADDTSFAASADPFVEMIDSNLKAVYMKLDFGREDVPPTVITDPGQKKEICIPLSTTQGDMVENSLVQFNFSGNVNEASALNWHDNDVKISLNYTLEAVPPSVEEITPTAIEIPVTEELTPPAIEIQVTEETTPPAIEVLPPAEEIASPAEEVLPPAEEIAPPAEEIAPPAEEVTPPEEEVMPPAEEIAPPAEEVPPDTETADTPGPLETSPETQDSPSEPST